MTGIEILAMITSLTGLLQRITVEKREATQAEVDASFASRDNAQVQAHAALERARLREEEGG